MTATTTAQGTVWVSSVELSKRLVISRNRMIELEALGVLIPGQHYVQQGQHRNSPKVWDLAAVEHALRNHTATRLTQQQEAV